MSKRVVTTKLYDQLQSEVHVWFCQPPTIQDALKVAEYTTVLSAQEIDQYHRFQFQQDKHSYLVSHAMLRYALSKYAELPASQWQFCKGEHGKPELVSSAMPDLCFNLTHTAGLSACVISLNRRVGVDAENIHRKNKLKAVAHRMFAEEELAQLDDKNIDKQFYIFWTLREAYVKALGTGLAGSSKAFYFTVDASDLSVVMHRKKKSHLDTGSWKFSLYWPTQEHVLAVGVESGDEVPIIMRHFVP